MTARTQHRGSPRSQSASASADVLPARKVLFIGNSFTNRNDLPGMFTRMAGSAVPSRRFEPRRVIANGMALKTHWNRGVAREAIRAEPWDFVVLQEQSTLPLKNRAKMHESVTLFDEEIRHYGARTVLYMTWARRSAFDRQDELSEAYESIGRQLSSLIAPVGRAWQRALAADPKLLLHDKDGSHPNALGTYLAACVFAAVLADLDPAALISDLPGLEKLAPDKVYALQKAAWQATRPVLPPGAG
jgi:hypothetical protein